jgi:hypothetical protein
MYLKVSFVQLEHFRVLNVILFCHDCNVHWRKGAAVGEYICPLDEGRGSRDGITC